jgi:uncharacterized RDD family membrane protein YckC
MEDRQPDNPYSPPASELNQGLVTGTQGVELAGRGTRLSAVTLDGLVISIPLLPMLALGIYFGVRAEAEMSRAVVDDNLSQMPSLSAPSSEFMVLLGIAAAIGMLGALGVAIYQWILISQTAQSLGKKWTGIRIERVDGSNLTFGTGVFLRNWVPKVMGAVPYLGMLFFLVDCLFIFREDRRCLHDHIAGTRVVRHQR